MVQNFPGPYELRLKYTAAGLEHEQRLNLDCVTPPAIGDPFTAITVKTRDAVGKLLSVATAEWLNLLKGVYDTSVVFGDVELWKYPALSYDAEFIAAGTGGGTGALAGGVTDAHQVTMTFRSAESGILRIVLLESTSSTNAQFPKGSWGAAFEAIGDYVVATDTWILCKDTSYPLVGLRLSGGQNERVWRKRYRP